ncbi:MAG: DNA polymerase III subunit gamma/tau [Thermoanaerobaculia bacterium]
MAYQVLARKWRPQDFSSVVGQEPIVVALRNALSEGRIAQAYLFSGIRGVGKTSVARVLAKALNCEKGLAAGPCNECVVCREITGGSDMDVIEVDAATYSKVEQVRELAESLKYGPARDRYKVVIIDEIHRLSRQAFDALLKIVEEPPEHLLFIFATTEVETVPATILSRCQEFHFRRVTTPAVAAHLATLAAAEEIEVSETALRLLARAGEGSVRDSVALLDQLATYGSGKIPDEEAARILGGVDAAFHHRLLTAITNGDGAGVAAVVQLLVTEGWEPRHVYSEFLTFCRDALHLALGVPSDQIDLPQEEAAILAELASGAGYENLLRLLHLLLSSEPTVRRSEAGSLAAEIAWLRAAELPKLTRVEEILGGGGGQRAPKKSSGAAPDTAPPEPSLFGQGSVQPEPDREGEGNPVPVEEGAAPPPAETAGFDSGRFADERVEALLLEVSRVKQSLAAHLGEAEQLIYADGELRIYTPPEDRWLHTALRRGNNREVLERCLAAIWGSGTRWRLLEKSPAPVSPEAEPGRDPALQHPTVQNVLGVFGGSARTIETD